MLYWDVVAYVYYLMGCTTMFFSTRLTNLHGTMLAVLSAERVSSDQR